MDTRTEFRDTVKKLLDEAPGFYLSEDNEQQPMGYVATSDMADRIMNLAENYFEAPEGLVEVRANIEKVVFKPGKDIEIAVSALNTPQNRMTLSGLESYAVTLRGCQLEIPMDTPKEDDGGEAEEDPDQAELEGWEDGDAEDGAETEELETAGVE